MPEIKQYQQQVNPTGPTNVQNATSANFGGTVADAIKGFGEEAAQTGQVLYRRGVQNDISDADVKVSLARQKLTQDFFDQKQKGTLNFEDFSKHVDETMDAAGQDIQTREAQLRFNQMKAATSAEFGAKALAGQAELAGTKTLANF